VSLFKRKITYFYEHDKGLIGNTAGFLKMEIRGDKVKILINIQERTGYSCEDAQLYFYHEAGDHLSAVKVDSVKRENGMLLYHNKTEWKDLFGLNRDLYTFDGVAVVCNRNHYYIGDFQDKNRQEFPLEIIQISHSDNSRISTEDMAKNVENKSKENIKHGEKILKENAQGEKWYEEFEPVDLTNKELGIDFAMRGKTEDAEMEAKEEAKSSENVKGTVNLLVGDELKDVKHDSDGVFSKCKSCPYQIQREQKKGSRNVFEELLAEYPKLPMYGAQELFDCVRIHPKDIGKLDMRNWKLGVNSFLTHGFYTYQYLMLGKMRFENGVEQPVLGVPGVYSNREKYVANMFGFEQFIPVKKTGIKTGEFGYWIVELV